MRWWLFVGLIFALSGVPSAASAQAEDEFAASFRLRTGYDSNPILIPSGKGSALVVLDGVIVAGRATEDFIAGVVAESSYTHYRDDSFTPVQNHKLLLRLANRDQDGVSLRSTTSVSRYENYDTRAEDVAQRLRAQWVDGAVRPFIVAEAKLASLNESNILLGSFLPEPMRFLRGTLTPGIAYRKDKFEAGVSFAVSRTKYENEFDHFGFKRDNDRQQPAIFVTYGDTDVEFSATWSYLRGSSQDPLFTDVNTHLFEVSLLYNLKPWTIDLAATRSAEDTTFPVSPLTINTVYLVKLAKQLDDKTRIAGFGRYLHKYYWDTPLESSVSLVGLEMSRLLSPDVTLAVELAYTHSTLISGDTAYGTVAMVGLSHRFGGEPKKIRAGN